MQLLPQNVLEKRLDILLNQVRDLSEQTYQRQVGTCQEVLLEEPTKGRSSGNFWVKTSHSYPVGSLIRCSIERAEGTLLFARNEYDKKI
jgi:tRNA A37 methylthiotransferase MiaB